MHVNDLECRNMGFNGIQGSTMVTCLGTAFASVYNGTDDVTAVFLGDGTLGEGTCHESMNMAATWKLPIIYCLVNNGYAISTRYEEAHPQKELKHGARDTKYPASAWTEMTSRQSSRQWKRPRTAPERARAPLYWNL